MSAKDPFGFRATKWLTAKERASMEEVLNRYALTFKQRRAAVRRVEKLSKYTEPAYFNAYDTTHAVAARIEREAK